MINWKYLKIQLKSSYLIILIFMMFFLLLNLITFVFFAEKAFASYNLHHDYVYPGGHGSSSSSRNGAWSVAPIVMFGLVGWLTISVFAITLVIKTMKSEINNGNISSWLTLPMSRTTILLTKYLFFIFSVLMIVSFNFILELIITKATYTDFSGKNALALFELNLGQLFLFLLMISIASFFALIIEKTSVYLLVMAVIFLWFFIFSAMSYMNFMMDTNKYAFAKYLTIYSLTDLTTKSSELPSINLGEGWSRVYDDHVTVINSNDANIAWKFILLILFTSGFSSGTWYFFKNKNLNV